MVTPRRPDRLTAPGSTLPPSAGCSLHSVLVPVEYSSEFTRLYLDAHERTLTGVLTDEIVDDDDDVSGFGASWRRKR